MPTLATQVMNASSVERLIREALTRVKNDIAQNMSKKGRNASGKSVASFRVETTGIGGVLWGSRSFMAMETGRKGGKVPYGFSDIIAQWIIDKGISVEPQKLHSVSWLIARNIKNAGTALYRQRGFDDIFSSAVERELKALDDNIMYQAESEINYIMSRFGEVK